MDASTDTLRGGVLRWFANGEIGTSSACMALVASTGEMPDDLWRRDHPRDPDDLNRCIRLVACVPEVRQQFSRLAEVSPEWAAVIAHWDELVELFHGEAGPNWSNARRAPRTYDRMQELFRTACREQAPR